MTIDLKTLKCLGKEDDVLSEGKKINHVLGNHKGARDHLMSKFLFTMNEEFYILRRF